MAINELPYEADDRPFLARPGNEDPERKDQQRAIVISSE